MSHTPQCPHTQVLVETAMLAAVSGLVFLLSTLLKLDNSLGYLLPMPIAIAALRSGAAAAWKTMMATSFLLIGGRCTCCPAVQRACRHAGLSALRMRCMLHSNGDHWSHRWHV